MQFSEVVRRRRMVRRYRDEPVDPAAIDRILDCARQAPSAGFSQGQSFVVVTAAQDRRHLADLCREREYTARGFQPWLSRAPVHVIACVSEADYRQRYAEPDKGARTPGGAAAWSVPWWWVDGGAALVLVLLAAVDEGLAAGLLAVGDPDGVRAVLGIPRDVVPYALVTVGHPAPDRPSSSVARGRRPRAEVVHTGRWGST